MYLIVIVSLEIPLQAHLHSPWQHIFLKLNVLSLCWTLHLIFNWLFSSNCILYYIFPLFQATYGAALRTKGSRSSLRSGPERENGGVGSSPDFPESMSTVPIARSSAVSLVWSLTMGLCAPLNHHIQPHGILYHYTLTAAMWYLFTDVSPLSICPSQNIPLHLFFKCASTQRLILRRLLLFASVSYRIKYPIFLL